MEGAPLEEVAAGSVRLHRWRADDAHDLHELVLANLEHLRPWMGWVAAEPLPIEERLSKVATWGARWTEGKDFAYAVVHDDGELVGGCGLKRCASTEALAIGYWVRGDRTGQGIATDAVRALLKSAFSMEGINHAEIHHDVANLASRRVPEKLGFTRVEERATEAVAPAEAGIDVIWRLDRRSRTTLY